MKQIYCTQEQSSPNAVSQSQDGVAGWGLGLWDVFHAENYAYDTQVIQY